MRDLDEVFAAKKLTHAEQSVPEFHSGTFDDLCNLVIKALGLLARQIFVHNVY